LGSGLRTHLELPAESSGLLPSPGKKHPNGTLEWSTPTPYSLAIGYNLQANSIQFLRAWALLANGGYFVQPTVIRKAVKTCKGETQKILIDHTSAERKETFPKVLDTDIVDVVVEAMKYVTKPGGTGRRADIGGFTEVGKSGTSKKIENGIYSASKYLGSFIGFTPVKDPVLLLHVVMDEPECRYIPGVGHNHYGSCCAAPVFKEIATRSLEYLGVTPDDPYGYPYWDPRYDRERADWLRETDALQEIYEKWNK